MANASIYAAFERMWRHIIIKIDSKVDTAMNELREEILGGEW